MYFNTLRCRKKVCFWLYAPSFDKIGSPRCSCSRSTQGCSHSSTTNHTSTRCCGCHRTRQGRTPIPLSCQGHQFFMSEILSQIFPFVSVVPPLSKIMENPARRMPRRVNPPNLPLRGSKLPRSPSCCYAATGGLQERLATTLVRTADARVSTFQHDKPHFDP